MLRAFCKYSDFQPIMSWTIDLLHLIQKQISLQNQKRRDGEKTGKMLFRTMKSLILQTLPVIVTALYFLCLHLQAA